jgi:predicted nucleic acid-binding protein
MSAAIDTNVLVYADSGDEPVRQSQALSLLAEHRRQGTGVLSPQVLQEFANVALRKLRLPPELVRARLVFYARFEVIAASPALIADALDLHALRGVSFYGALIVQAAIAGGCAQLPTEDMQAGAVLAGVRIVNPFAVMA